MTSIKVEIKTAAVAPAHHLVTVWAGPSPEHRAGCGVLTMTPEESAELIARVEAGEPNRDQVSPEVARHVLWHYGATGGAEPGAFTRYVIAAIQVADCANRPLMRAQFPAYVKAMQLAAGTDDGIERLQRIAADEA